MTAAAALALTATAAEAQPLEGFDGTWVYAGGQKQRARVEKAIEALVGEMNPLYRLIARRRLKAAAKVPQRFEFKTLSEGRLSVRVDSGPARITKLDGTPIHFDNDEGQKIRLHRVVRGSTLVTVGGRGDAAQQNTYRLDSGGRTMNLTITITSDRLPRPLRYQLTYRRQG